MQLHALQRMLREAQEERTTLTQTVRDCQTRVTVVEQELKEAKEKVSAVVKGSGRHRLVGCDGVEPFVPKCSTFVPS